jgi:hypothetical protein
MHGICVVCGGTPATFIHHTPGACNISSLLSGWVSQNETNVTPASALEPALHA